MWLSFCMACIAKPTSQFKVSFDTSLKSKNRGDLSLFYKLHHSAPLHHSARSLRHPAIIRHLIIMWCIRCLLQTSLMLARPSTPSLAWLAWPSHHFSPWNHLSITLKESQFMACMAKPPFQPKEPASNHVARVSIYVWPNIPSAPKISPCMACAWPRKNYSTLWMPTSILTTR
ncbi:hypothetical protein L3X38_010951 [Prunus dulcis]|uniref:Uncharacterized protein n=1 Tax=Prunus dulcis TaxID=3755 RepID=A0AAD4ZEJ6_PRUDU|nr:hypothetical protein L3X38_010951 [Prunus dulcis]